MPTLNSQMITAVRHALVLLTSASVATATVKTKICHTPKRSTKLKNIRRYRFSMDGTNMWTPGIILISMIVSISSTRLKTGRNAMLIKNTNGLIKIVCHQAAKMCLNLSASFTLKIRAIRVSTILNTTAQRIPKKIPLTAISAIAAALVDPNSSILAKLFAYCGLMNFCVNGKIIHANTTTRKQRTRNAIPHFGLDFSRVNVAFGFAMRSMRFCQLSLMILTLRRQRYPL